MDFDLSISRLKILGDEKIIEIDNKIKLYKHENNITPLHKSLDEIQNKINDLYRIYISLQNEFADLKKEKEIKENNIKNKISSLEKLSEEKLDIEKNIQENNKILEKHQDEINTMNTQIIILKENEKKLNNTVSLSVSKLQCDKETFKKQRDLLETNIIELQKKTEENMKQSLLVYSNHIEAINSIQFKPVIEDYKHIFNNIKIKMCITLAKNAKTFRCRNEPYQTDIEFRLPGSGPGMGYNQNIVDDPFLYHTEGFSLLRNIHKHICVEKEININTMCTKCNTSFKYYSNYGNTREKEETFNNWRKQYGEPYFKKYFKEILLHYLKNDEIKYLINNVKNSADLIVLFNTSNLFPIQDNIHNLMYMISLIDRHYNE